MTNEKQALRNKENGKEKTLLSKIFLKIYKKLKNPMYNHFKIFSLV
jgi:hypothetical protein